MNVDRLTEPDPEDGLLQAVARIIREAASSTPRVSLRVVGDEED